MLMAEHPRSYDKGQQIETEEHIRALTEYKKQARLHRGQDRLAKAVPSCTILLIQAAERGYNLRTITASLLQLLEQYGAAELTLAVEEALKRQVPHPNAVRLSLEKQREEKNLPPPITIPLPDDDRVRELVIRPHDLTEYDQLQT